MNIPPIQTDPSIFVEFIRGAYRKNDDSRYRMDVALSLVHKTNPATLELESRARLHGVISQDLRDVQNLDAMIDMMLLMIENASTEAVKGNWMWGTIKIKVSHEGLLYSDSWQFWVNPDMDIKAVMEWNYI